MSAESEALFTALAAARQLADVQAKALKQTPLPAASVLNAGASAVSASAANLQNLIQALETSTTVAAKKAQVTAASGLTNNIKLLRDKITQASDRLVQLGQQGAL